MRLRTYQGHTTKKSQPGIRPKSPEFTLSCSTPSPWRSRKQAGERGAAALGGGKNQAVTTEEKETYSQLGTGKRIPGMITGHTSMD